MSLLRASSKPVCQRIRKARSRKTVKKCAMQLIQAKTNTRTLTQPIEHLLTSQKIWVQTSEP